MLWGTANASADAICWNFGFHSPGEACHITSKYFGAKALIGKVVPSKERQKDVCLYENPFTGVSIRSDEFISLVGNYTGFRQVMPDADSIPAPQLINRFHYCHPETKKAKDYLLKDLFNLPADKQDTICFNTVRDKNGNGVELGIWDNEKSSCVNLDIAYMKDGVLGISEMKNDARIVQALRVDIKHHQMNTNLTVYAQTCHLVPDALV